MLHDSNLERELDGLLNSYRAACPDPEPGASFTSGLWNKIEARRSFGYQCRRFAMRLVTLAATATVAIALYLALPQTSSSQFYMATYVEALDAAPDQIALADYEAVDYPREMEFQ